MKRHAFITSILLCVLWAAPLRASSRAIVRIEGAQTLLNTVCGLLGCSVAESIGDPANQLFLVTSNLLDLPTLLSDLLNIPGVVDCEPDLLANASGTTYTAPAALTDTTPIAYYGTTVPDGYVNQPATSIVRVSAAQGTFNVSGTGTVAVIDTGVDPNHPALSRVLLPGYDFTRNRPGADETRDATFSSPPTSGSPDQVNSTTVADVDQSTAAVVDGPPGYSDFGHGTMVAGIIHLVAPTAAILPLKAFGSDGLGYTSDILRAIYTAVNENARVINMSFNLAGPSREVKTALQYANTLGVICVAAAGNSGTETLVYPAAYANLAMGIASTSNTDQRSSFSNYGPQLVWVAAPGEGVVTTYPFGLYAAGWGTSFSTPFVSGTAALLVQMGWQCNESSGAQAIAHAVSLTSDLGKGRLDIYQAAQAWQQASQIP